MTEDINQEKLRLRIQLEPVDTLFFRDARPFEAATRANSGLPMPQTLAGAIRTALIHVHGVDPAEVGRRIRQGAGLSDALSDFGTDVEGIADVSFRGPWFQRTEDEGPLVPVPANLRRTKESERLVLLSPLASPPIGWKPQMKGMLPLWRRGRETVESVEGYLTLNGLKRYLESEVPSLDDIVAPSELYSFEDRTGIGVDVNRNTAGEGQIYGIRMLTMRNGVHLVCEANGPKASLTPLHGKMRLMRLGGEGRQVRLIASVGSIRWPAISQETGSGRLLLMTTPAGFGGWQPPELRPISAAVPGYLAVSGWDLARQAPKPNRFMVPAGAVYFLSPGDNPPPDVLVSPEDAQAGWGDFLEGNWRYV